MSSAKKIYNWILFSIFCQIAVLVFFNYYYLGNRGEAKATLIDIKTEKPKKTQKTEVPANSKDIKVSYDNTLISYVKDNKIEIKDIEENKILKTIEHKGNEISYYRWLPDRNTIIYAIKVPDSQAGNVQVITFNVDSEIDHLYPKITGIPAKSHITDIELSPLTNVVYAKVVIGGGKAKIYKYNIESQLSFVMNISEKTEIKEMIYNNKLIYRDEQYRVFEWDGLKGSSKLLKFTGKLELLGISGVDDEVFVGVLDDSGKVKEVRYGTTDKDINSWEKIEVKTPVSSEDIYVEADGNVYELIKDKSQVYNLKTSDKTSFSGTFVEIFSNHLVTKDGNSVKIENMGK